MALSGQYRLRSTTSALLVGEMESLLDNTDNAICFVLGCSPPIVCLYLKHERRLQRVDVPTDHGLPV